MADNSADGKATQATGQTNERATKFIGTRSTEWTSKLSQVRGNVQKKVAGHQDTRRFADGRTR